MKTWGELVVVLFFSPGKVFFLHVFFFFKGGFKETEFFFKGML